MSVRTNDPRPPEIFKPALCTVGVGCGKPYESICGKCNLAYCLDHLKAPHGCGNWPATRLAAPEKWPPLDPGTRVRTTSSQTPDSEWMPEALASRKWGMTGTIVMHHDSHGLCYDVRHDDGTEGCYDPGEFDVIQGIDLSVRNGGPNYVVGQQVAPGLVVIHQETLKKLQGPFTCGHPAEFAGGACAACHALTLEKLDAVILQIRELQEDKEALIQQRDRAHAAADSQEKDLDAANLQLSNLRDAVQNLLKAPHNSFNDAMWREKVKGLLPPAENRPAVYGVAEPGALVLDNRRPEGNPDMKGPFRIPGGDDGAMGTCDCPGGT